MLVTLYLEPLLAAAADKASGLLSEHDVNVLLGNLALVDMRHANTALLNALQQRVEPWHDECVFADVLQQQLMSFRSCYSEVYNTQIHTYMYNIIIFCSPIVVMYVTF